MLKKIITKLKEIETIVELNVGKELTEDTATDIYELINSLMCDVKKMPIYDAKNRNLYKELKTLGLSTEASDKVLDLIDTLHN